MWALPPLWSARRTCPGEGSWKPLFCTNWGWQCLQLIRHKAAVCSSFLPCSMPGFQRFNKGEGIASKWAEQAPELSQGLASRCSLQVLPSQQAHRGKWCLAPAHFFPCPSICAWSRLHLLNACAAGNKGSCSGHELLLKEHLVPSAGCSCKDELDKIQTEKSDE